MQIPLKSAMRVYLAEDEVLLGESMRALLDLEVEIVVAGEVAGALKELETMDVDVVLMDIGLPDMDGIEAIRRLTEKGNAPAVLVLTSHNGDFLEAAMDAGDAGYMSKSCNRR